MKRPNTVKVDATAIQGEGAFVEWRRLTWAERREAVQQAASLEGEARKGWSVRFILNNLVGWNLVDGDGNPLPVPKTPGDLDALYPDETRFLDELAGKALLGQVSLGPEDLKN
jgi:hypothetical protein